MARALEPAQRFYSEVLGWEFHRSRLGDEFSVAFQQGVPVAGIGALDRGMSVPVAWTPYFAVDDADATAARIRERTGTVAVGPLSFGTGRAAIAADPDGAVFGIWEGRAIPNWAEGPDMAPPWIELRTRDAFAAAIFYGGVLDWACDRPDCCSVSYEDDHVVLRHGGEPIARLGGGAVDAAPDPQVRPRWHVHFRVPDPAAAAEAATKLGGAVVSSPPTRTSGQAVTLRDPDGALFTIDAVEAPMPPAR